MRVLHVIPSVSPAHGGPSAVLRTMTAALAAAGAEVDVATTDDDGVGRRFVPLGQPLAEDRVTYWYFARQARTYRASLPLARWLRGHAGDYDIVHIHALFSFAALPAATSARAFGVPYVVRPLGVLNRWGRVQRRAMLKSLSLRTIERPILAGAAAIQWTSAQEQAEADDLALRAPSVIVPNPVALPASVGSVPTLPKAWSLDDGAPVVLFLSRIDAVKGVDVLLDAFAAIRSKAPIARLVIAGTGAPQLTRALQAHSRRLELDRALVWAGHVDGAVKESLYRRAAVFVLPSRSENFGVAAVEAAARGKAVVVTDRVGVHREIEGAGAGLAVPVDAPALGRAILHYLDDPEARDEAGRRGQELVRTRYAPDAVARQLLDLYSDLTRGTRPRASYADA